ncbi:MAG: hypothetical protein ABSG02_19120 [Terriglobales bacterium]|jgi:hypothetical protein
MPITLSHGARWTAVEEELGDEIRRDDIQELVGGDYLGLLPF